MYATSGMGAPSMSIVVNELVQAGIRTVIRIGTAGSIQDHVRIGSVVMGSGALTNQGAADDIAPSQYPAVADPFLTVALAGAASDLQIDHHVGVMASTDTFFEGQERSGSSGQRAPAAAAPRHDRRVPDARRPELRDGGRHALQDGRRIPVSTPAGVCGIIAQRAEDGPPPRRREGRRRRPGDPRRRRHRRRVVSELTSRASSTSQAGRRAGRPSAVTMPCTVTAVAAGPASIRRYTIWNVAPLARPRRRWTSTSSSKRNGRR